MNAYKRLSIIAITLLTACAAPRPPEQMGAATETPPGNHKAQIQAQGQSEAVQTKGAIQDKSTVEGKAAVSSQTISSFELSGAIAARNKTKSWTATINWLQQGAGHYQIRLFGPLGSGTVMIDKKGGKVVLRDGPKNVSSNNADQLLKKQTGVGLPVASLYYWVRGLPAPGPVQSAKRDKYNNLTLLRQGGYTIEFPTYAAVGKAHLPRQIKLNGNGVFIKLIIKKWNV